MKLSAVLAGCLVVACCTVNTQATDPIKCPDNVVLVFDCLDSSNTVQWDAVKNYTKLIIQHMSGTADESTPRLGLFALDGEEKAGGDLVSQLKSDYAKNKRGLMAFIDRMKTSRKEIQLKDSIRKLEKSEVFSGEDDRKTNCIVVIRDGSVHVKMDAVEGSQLRFALESLTGDMRIVHLIRINDAAEDADANGLSAWFTSFSVSGRFMADHSKPDYKTLTPQDAFNFVKDDLHCDPFGKVDDPLESSATGVTLPPPPPTQQLPDDSTTHSYALSLTRTTGVVGLWMSVVIAAALSTF